MKKYRLEDKLNFGQYKGEDMRFIYTFDPKYVEWLILNNDHFFIDLNEYKDRHTYQIDIQETTQRLGVVTVSTDGSLRNLSLRKYLAEFFTDEFEDNYLNTPRITNKFSFSENAISVLNNKLNKSKIAKNK